MNVDFTKAINSNPVLKRQLLKLARIKGVDIETLVRSFFGDEGRSTLESGTI